MPYLLFRKGYKSINLSCRRRRETSVKLSMPFNKDVTEQLMVDIWLKNGLYRFSLE
jgi:hypothetical protein